MDSVEDPTNVLQFRAAKQESNYAEELIAAGLLLVKVFMAIPSAEDRQKVIALAQQLSPRPSGDPA